jgi:hypothetical protein
LPRQKIGFALGYGEFSHAMKVHAKPATAYTTTQLFQMDHDCIGTAGTDTELANV